MTDLTRDPHLLIKTHKDPKDLKRRIAAGRVRPLAPMLPICRFRGTAIYPDGTLIGWQRNISRLKKMDVSLPTIITLTLGPDHTIADIDLDPCFKGSKGLMCSHPYLNRNLKRHLAGARLDNSLFSKIKQRHLHCFHLVEVLSGVTTFYRMHRHLNLPDGCVYEQEVGDIYSSGNDLVAQGKQDLNGERSVRYTIHYIDILKRIAFDESGRLSKLDDLEMVFYLNGKPVMSQVVNLDHRFKKMLTFMLGCIKHVKRDICPDIEIPYKNTNLLPSALLSLLTQAAAMHLFDNNYTYVMHVLSALQRKNNVPVCVGAIRDEAEAEQFFPDYHLGEII